jgi:hypothetical protein
VPGRPPLRVALLALVLAAGCTSEPAPAPKADGPVDVAVPIVPDPRERAACATLIAALPDEVDPGVERRQVRDDALTAAWGDPPVTLMCGVAAPDRPEEPVIVNGVSWTVRDIGPGFQWTTSGRLVSVAVQIPDAYENGVEIVNPLSGPVAQALPAVSPSPAP